MTLADLQSSENKDVEMERLQSWAIGDARILAPSLINIAAILSIPADFVISRFLRMSLIVSSLTGGN